MLNLNMVSPINQLGYGQVGTNLVRTLSEMTHLSLTILGIPELYESDEQIVRDAVDRCRLLPFDAPCIRLYHQKDMSYFLGRGVRIGFSIFELDKFNRYEQHHLKSLDKMFVASQWAKQIIVQNNLLQEDDVYVIPLGQSIAVDPPVARRSGPTKFFTCGKWEVRKGHDKLIEAFCKAFGPNDDVELHMMCVNPFLNATQTNEWKRLYAESPMGHKVRFLPRVARHNQVIEIMKSMDCGIFLSRAEGWNLELLEMICCGKPVIATNYSGHTEFCNRENCMLVEMDQLVPAFDDFWFDGTGGRWADLGERQIEQAIDHMRKVHADRGVNMYGYTVTRQKFTWTNSAKRIVSIIENL